ncbi:MAG TPA: winged helix-turn-helix domain-containing protein [Tepidisphaeraceae bacterium]|jgi:hypothetical protein|nr:winged helix-turn-helix domain-containing protein [Tepidisphaeraceae bacterium]
MRYRKIEVDEEVFARIKATAVPFDDFVPNDVLRRLLGLPKAKRNPAHQPGKPQSRRAYLGETILQVLENEGGSAASAHVLGIVEQLLSPTPYDREIVRPGIERWKKDTHFSRLALVRAGLIQQKSPRGVWALTSKGRKKAQDLIREIDRVIEENDRRNTSS